MRTIDAEALEKDGWMMHRTVQVDKNNMSYETKKPTDFPVIEPERKTGKWILTEKGAVATAYQCSICGRSIINDTGYDVCKDYPFCHCGAAMTEKQDD